MVCRNKSPYFDFNSINQQIIQAERDLNEFRESHDRFTEVLSALDIKLQPKSDNILTTIYNSSSKRPTRTEVSPDFTNSSWKENQPKSKMFEYPHSRPSQRRKQKYKNSIYSSNQKDQHDDYGNSKSNT